MTSSNRQPLVGFVMEQTLGHVTYAQNLARALAYESTISPVWIPVSYASDSAVDRLPGVRSNWALRGSSKAFLQIRSHPDRRHLDALFLHTQTIALSGALLGRRIPSIVSLDATPINYDSVGVHYGHHSQPDSAGEALKRRIYRRVFREAAGLTTWSDWAKRSLGDDYGVDPERVVVVRPGIDLSLFDFGCQPCPCREEPRLKVLFVGGDFERKGGALLLDCLRGGLAEECELHIVTRSPVAEGPGVHVYRDLGPNDPRLLSLYRDADVFALPTYADCLAVVLGEAMASGLPIVTTDVGAQREAVIDGESGIIVKSGDAAGLGRALRRLVADAELRRRMGIRGRSLAEEQFDVRKNAARLAAVIRQGIERWHRARLPEALPAGAA